MTRLAVPVPNLLGGVSQQGARRRLANQVARMDDAWASPIDSLRKRHPIDHVARISTGAAVPELRMHTIARGTEKYVVLLGNGTVDVYTDEGVEVPVKGPTAPYAPDFSYIDQRAENELLFPETLAEPTWNRIGGALVVTTTTDTGPLGFGAAVRGGIHVMVPTSSGYRQAVPLGSQTARKHFSVYLRQPATPNVCPSMTLVLREGGVSQTNFVCDFSFTASFPDLPELIATPGSAEVQGRAVDLGDGWWRAEMTYQPDGASLASLDYVQISLSPDALDADCFMDLWGAQFVDSDSYSFGNFPTYARGGVLADIRATTVQDFTFVTNAAVPVQKTATTAGSNGDRDEVFVFVRQGGYSQQYTVEVQIQGFSLRTATVDTFDGNMTGPGELPSVETQTIAEELAELLMAHAELLVTTSGNIVSIRPAAAANPITTFRVVDSFGGTAMVAINESVTTFSDLPLTFIGGERVKVVGDPTAGEDDFWVRFVADDGGLGVFRDGKWEESNEPDSLVEIDEDTMPHQLVRRFDDATGTVTGTPRAVYFEWGPATWAQRLVGDDASNPFPSFVSTASEARFIRDVFFFRGRLGVLSGIHVVLAEAGDAFNFFRTTVRTIVDSDRIDAEASHRLEGELHAAVPIDERLILFGQRTIFALSGQPTLTPKTVEIPPVLELPSTAGPLPVGVGRSVLFATEHADHGALRELFPLNERNTFDQVNLTEQAPRYIVGAIEEIDGRVTEDEMVVAARAAGDPTKLYVYKAYTAGRERVQSAVWRYRITGEVRGLGWIDDRLFLAVARGGELCLESMTIGSGMADEASAFQVCLDRRVTDLETSPTYDANLGSTTYTLPYDLSDAELVRVVTRATSAGEGGMPLSIEAVTASTVRVDGDRTGVAVWIGERYEMVVEPGRPNVTARGDSGTAPVLEGAETILGGALYAAGPLHLDLRVAPRYGGEYVERLRAAPIDSAPVPGEIGTAGRSWEFSIIAPPDDVVVTIENDSHLPTRIESLEWYLAKRGGASRAG